MKPLSYSGIYKIYKHGGSLKDVNPYDVYDALRKNGLQSVLVRDLNKKIRVYNFVPETGKFYRLV